MVSNKGADKRAHNLYPFSSGKVDIMRSWHFPVLTLTL